MLKYNPTVKTTILLLKFYLKETYMPFRNEDEQ